MSTPMNKVRFIKEKDGFFTFQIIDFVHREPKYAVAVGMATELGEANDLEDLPAIFELVLIIYMIGDIKKLRDRGEKFIFVINLTHFPYIICRFDQSDPNIDMVGDQFSKDVAHLWNTYDNETMMLIVTNIHNSHTALKAIDLKGTGLMPLLDVKK